MSEYDKSYTIEIFTQGSWMIVSTPKNMTQAIKELSKIKDFPVRLTTPMERK